MGGSRPKPKKRSTKGRAVDDQDQVHAAERTPELEPLEAEEEKEPRASLRSWLVFRVIKFAVHELLRALFKKGK